MNTIASDSTPAAPLPADRSTTDERWQDAVTQVGEQLRTTLDAVFEIGQQSLVRKIERVGVLPVVMGDVLEAADNVFVFLHHPRWLKNNYGDDWEHDIVVEGMAVVPLFVTVMW